MEVIDAFGLLLLAAVGWLWLDSSKAREAAVASARAACNSEGLLLLDDTVAIMRIALARDLDGVLHIRRSYAFEYSDTGNDRTAGSIAMLGSRVLAVHLNLPDLPDPTVLH